jgi:hypothetical protein
MPTSFQYFTNEPSAVSIAQFPFILLPGVLVPIAYSLHIFSLRQLFINTKQQAIKEIAIPLSVTVKALTPDIKS